jgi:hypothetical protein
VPTSTKRIELFKYLGKFEAMYKLLVMN